MYRNMAEFDGEMLTVGRVINGKVVQLHKHIYEDSAKELWHWLKLFERLDDGTFKLYAYIEYVEECPEAEL